MYGGGIRVESGTLKITAGTITGNKATRGGGVAYKSAVTYSKTGGTISGNTPTDVEIVG